MRVTEEIKDLVAYACYSCGVNSLADQILVEFNHTFTRIMGRATVAQKPCDFFYIGNNVASKYRIRLSAPLWSCATQEERNETVIHEACHIIDYNLNGKMCGHKDPWKKLMVKCGVKPERYHKVDSTGVVCTPESVTAFCGCGQNTIGPFRAKCIINRETSYRCNKCSETIVTQESCTYA